MSITNRPIRCPSCSEMVRYREGKHNLFGFFMGQVMKKSRGKANPELANRILRKYLD